MQKIQMQITEDFNNQILKTAETLGMSKNEFVKYCISNVMVGLVQSQNAINNYIEEMRKEGK